MKYFFEGLVNIVIVIILAAAFLAGLIVLTTGSLFGMIILS